MAYVPGFQHDVFISYAHGDDRDWINRFLDSLKAATKQRLGREADFWIDTDDLRKSRDFTKEIPDSVRASAVFLLLASPSYIRSEYCVLKEAKAFGETIATRRARFSEVEFANEKFVLRCPILPVEDNEHWRLFPGASDIPFCNQAAAFSVGTPDFDSALLRLAGELKTLLERMRNHSTPVFLYPVRPGADLSESYRSLADELSAQSYRLLPDVLVDLENELDQAELAVFLLGESYDETARSLADAVARRGKPWVVWSSPAAELSSEPDQMGFSRYLEQLASAQKTWLNAAVTIPKLKEEVLALLRPNALSVPVVPGRPTVYLIYNWRDMSEKGNASDISFRYRSEFQFAHPNDPSRHKLLLTSSDGVLLIWGNEDEAWCSQEFEEMVRTATRARAKGLCLLDPKEAKAGVLTQIRAQNTADIYIAEQFGGFDVTRMESFFNVIRRRIGTGQP
jgi:TIR domain